jgi:hypothetical protein
MMSVSIDSGTLDLFSPKFGLDGLGTPREKIMIRVVVASKDGLQKKTVFGSYTVGSRHAQIASREMETFGSEVDVVSVNRYTMKDFIEDVDKGLGVIQRTQTMRLTWESGKARLNLDGQSVPITFKEMYPTAGKACGIFECKDKSVKVMLGEDVQLFDLQRRKLRGLRLRDGKLILERAFQNPD